jgi:hypothetical protein
MTNDDLLKLENLRTLTYFGKCEIRYIGANSVLSRVISVHYLLIILSIDLSHL